MKNMRGEMISLIMKEFVPIGPTMYSINHQTPNEFNKVKNQMKTQLKVVSIKHSNDNNYGSSMSGNIVSTQQVFRNLSSALRRAQLTLAAVVDVNTYKGLFSLRYETAVTNNQCDQIWRF